jgi:uncharacterized protein (TIGR03000 family)
MRVRELTLAMALLGGLYFVAFAPLLALDGPAQQVTLRLRLPHKDAKVKVDGKAYPGQGDERRLTAPLPAGKTTLTVTTVWEPNNYTTITRKRTVTPGGQDEVTLDVTKADAAEKDDIVVRYVPTPQEVAEGMCKMAKVGPNDVVYDLGCGDGRIVITAVKQFGAKRGVGVDIDPKLVKDSRANAVKAGVADKVEVRLGDVLKIKDLSDATVVMLYMGDDINLRLRPILKKTLKPGARIVSHRFTMGDWKPERSEVVKGSLVWPCRIHLWRIGKKE